MSAPAIHDDRVSSTDDGWKVPTELGDWHAKEVLGGWVLYGPNGAPWGKYPTASEALAVPLGGQPT